MRCNVYSLVRFIVCAIGFVGVGSAPQLGRAEETVWLKTKLSKWFHGEGGTLADFDGDGHTDVAAGYMAFFGPDYKASAAIYPAKPYNINGYSEFFFDFNFDIDGDGDQDVVMVGFPGAAAHWYCNPGGAKSREGNWERFVIMDVVDNESPSFADLTGDGRPELLCCSGGQYGYAEIPSDPKQKWSFHVVSAPGPYQRFTHGMGIGDVNDDGHKDMIAKDGWWQNPGKATNELWVFHPYDFSGPGGAQMYAVDLDSDGKTEIVTSLAAHGYGLSIYKKADSSGDAWVRQDIMTEKVETSPTGLAISQLHAVDIADMDGDNKPDIVTGKRFWAHNGNDAGENDPPMLVWFKPIVVPGGLRFSPNIIDSDSGVGTQVLVRDANGDGRMDILSVSKRGVHLLTQTVPANTSPAIHPRDRDGAIAEHSLPIKDAIGGYRPAWSASESMNMDFERGDTTDWATSGGAFFNQPIQGDTVAVRNKDSKSMHLGEYWIGSYEVGTDVAMGEMVSRPFKLTHPWLSFLIGGGSVPECGLEIIDPATGMVLGTYHGKQNDTLERIAVDGRSWVGRPIQIKLFDRSRDAWGHINFDDLRLHDSEPTHSAKP